MLNIPSDINVQSIHTVLRICNNREHGTIHHYAPNLPHHELVYVRTGHSINTLNGIDYDFCAGSIMYMPQCDHHSYRVLTLERGECIDIYFHIDRPLASHPVLIPPPHRQDIADLFTQCDELWLSNSTVRQLKVKSALYSIFALLQEESLGQTITSTAQNALDEGLQYLTRHCFDSKIDYHRAAEISGVSYSYLKRLFVEKIGMPPVRFVTHRRMDTAKDYLTATTDSISEIAEALGYSSVYYFSRVFQQENGISPTEYRKQME